MSKSKQLNIDLRPSEAKEFIGYKEAELLEIKTEVEHSRAVLIVGPTGSGKTTLALWLAHQIVKDPRSVHDANAASESGVDDVRKLISMSKNKTLSGGSRVFIVDEIHELSSKAVSALLKPFEEPQSDTVWIGCTNAPERLPQTLRDRALIISTPTWSRKRLLRLAKRVSRKTGKPIPTNMRDFQNPRQLLTFMQRPDKAAMVNKKANTFASKYVLAALLGEPLRGNLYTFNYSAIMEISKACRALMGATLVYEKPDAELVAMLRGADAKLVARIANGCATALRDDTRPPMVLLDVLMCSVAASWHFEEQGVNA